MTVKQLAQTCGLHPAVMPNGEREITGVYIGDLLSWVMGRAADGDAWLTIMSNQNIVAVASLASVACVVLTEGVKLDAGVAELAAQKGINVLYAADSSYETAKLLASLL